MQKENAGLVLSKWLVALGLSVWASAPAAIQALMVLMFLDWFTGVINAKIAGTFCARIGLEGLWRKVLTLILVVAANRLIAPLHLPIDFASTIALAFDFNEFSSFVQNCAMAGVPIPPALLDVLMRARKLTGRSLSASDVRRELNDDGDAKPAARDAKAGQ
jgi:toxin secretion/phage lysis holin